MQTGQHRIAQKAHSKSSCAHAKLQRLNCAPVFAAAARAHVLAPGPMAQTPWHLQTCNTSSNSSIQGWLSGNVSCVHKPQRYDGSGCSGYANITRLTATCGQGQLQSVLSRIHCSVVSCVRQLAFVNIPNSSQHRHHANQKKGTACSVHHTHHWVYQRHEELHPATQLHVMHHTAPQPCTSCCSVGSIVVFVCIIPRLIAEGW